MWNLKTLFLSFVAICVYGQTTPLSCSSSGATNTPVRAEGLSELVGDFLVVCSGGTPTPAGTPVPAVDIKIFLNTPITSRLLAPYWPDVLLTIDEPAPNAQRACGTSGDVEALPGICTITGTGTGAGVYSGAPGRPNVFQGTLFGSSMVLFSGIPIDPPGTAPSQRVLRIMNLRGNVNAVGTTSGNVPPPAITATIIAPSLPLTGSPIQALGSVQTGIDLRLNPAAPTFDRTVPQNPGLVADPNSSGVSQFSLRVQERFATSLKKRNIATRYFAPNALGNQNDPARFGLFNEETGYFNSSFPTVDDHGNLGLAGLPDSGTRVMARFAQIPAGVSLFSQVFGTVAVNNAFRMVNTDVNGAGPYSAIVGNSIGIAPIPVVDGIATAVYEIVESDTMTLAAFEIPIYVAYGSNPPATGTVIANLSYAPLSTVGQASATESIPRFAENSEGWKTAFTITTPCTLTLGASSVGVPLEGGTGSVTVITPPGCAWTAAADDILMIKVTPSANGINYTVAQNPIPIPRSYRINFFLANSSQPAQFFTINQSGLPCTFTLDPGPTTWRAEGGSSVIGVKSSPSGCFAYWTAQSSVSWITATVTTYGAPYTVDTNTGAARTGTITVAGQAVTITQRAAVPSPLSVTPGNPGAPQVIVYTFTHPGGWQNLGLVDILMNTFLDGRGACYVAFIPSGPTSGTVLLVDDAGNAGGPFVSMQIPGSGAVYNSQCYISGTGSYVSASGNTLTLGLNTSLGGSTVGNKVIYMAAQDTASNNSGWEALGIWNSPLPIGTGPVVKQVTPARTTTASQTYTFEFAHSSDYSNLAVLNVLTNRFLDGRNGCYVAVVPTGPTTGTVLLVNDNGDAGGPFASMAIGGSGEIHNSQCSIQGAGSSLNGSGAALTLKLPITFNPSFSGGRVIYAAARTNTESSGWWAVGTVAVP